MIYGLIIAAGDQKRFKSDIPKALAVINGETLLDRNLRALNKVCDDVRVICSFNNSDYFNIDNKIVIKSGNGCGDAVLKALVNLPLTDKDTCFIQWGDSFMEDEGVYNLLIKEYNNLVKYPYENTILIPCGIEDKPYVQVIQNGEHLNILFSKYGEETAEGYHDLSLFYGNAEYLRDKLIEHINMIRVGDKFIHKHGNEMQFLDVFNDTNIKGKIIKVNYNSKSFNSIEELERINNNEN